MEQKTHTVIYRHWFNQCGGHISLEIPELDAYLSFWPSEKSSKSGVCKLFDTISNDFKTYQFDEEHTDGIYSQICLFSLDGQKILDQATKLANTMKWGAWSGKDLFEQRNCAGFVLEILIAGGLRDLLNMGLDDTRIQSSFFRGVRLGFSIDTDKMDANTKRMTALKDNPRLSHYTAAALTLLQDPLDLFSMYKLITPFEVDRSICKDVFTLNRLMMPNYVSAVIFYARKRESFLHEWTQQKRVPVKEIAFDREINIEEESRVTKESEVNYADDAKKLDDVASPCTIA